MTLKELRLPLIALAGAVLLAAATSHAKATDTFKQTYPLSATGTISLSNVNGDVEIVAWDKPEVSLEAEKTAPDAEGLKRLHIEVDSTPDHLSVKTVHDKVHAGFFWIGSSNSRGSVRYKLMVPAGASLRKIDTVNADITVQGLTGEVALETVNGAITAKGLVSQGRFETVNGSIHVTYASLPAHGKIALETVNGSNHITVPKDAGFDLEADSVNGQIRCDLPITLERASRRHLHGTVGAGGSRISLESVNGSLTVASR